ncbi:MAG: class I SAM-dependent methyltransferase [Actinobacteria bacterium]|nr:class I SAM-dependent methyltransferase [Actinomycetota bacterium]
MTDLRTQIVERGYDVISDHFLEWRDQIVDGPRREWSEALTSRLADGARILELGCGAGVPDTLLLAERFRVTGVDISGEQISRARANVPDAEFIHADFTALELEPAQFEAVAAFYSFNHTPRDLLGGLFESIRSWLVPDGLLLAAFGTSDTGSWTGDWLGTTMFFSSFPPETTRRMLSGAGFELLRDELAQMQEPESAVAFHWVLARR